jgi:hypothetical protein
MENIQNLEKKLGLPDGWLTQEIDEATGFLKSDDCESLEQALMHMINRTHTPADEIEIDQMHIKMMMSGYIVAIIIADTIFKKKLEDANAQLKSLLDLVKGLDKLSQR